MANGGVAQFVKNLSPFFKKDTIIFYRGKRKPKSYFDFAFPLIDVIRYFGFVMLKRPKKVIINSSLAKVGIIRDGLFILISKLIGAKTILYIHGFDDKALEMKYFLNNGYFKADKIFVLSSKFKNQLQALGCNKPIAISNNPISIDLIEGPEKKVLEGGPERLNILMMSRIVGSKGIFVGLEAFVNLQNYNVNLHIAGTGPDLDRARQYVESNNLKNVFFHGFITGEKKMQLLYDSDILLFPTTHKEGLPINVLEGLAMGLYIITRPVAGINDLKKNYHLDLVSSTEATDYQEIIISLIESGLPKAEIIENQTKARVDFSPKNIVKEVVLSS